MSKMTEVFRDFKRDEMFVIGSTPEERAKILYIRTGMSPSKIERRLKQWGDSLTLKIIRGWILKGKWRELRKKFKDTYSTEVQVQRAKHAATADVSNENQTRAVYAEISADIANSIKQKLNLATTPDSGIPNMSVNDIATLSIALDTVRKVHFQSLGIPELIKIDPTSGFEGIRIIPAHDDPELEKESEE